jgi:hypothetical protein
VREARREGAFGLPGVVGGGAEAFSVAGAGWAGLEAALVAEGVSVFNGVVANLLVEGSPPVPRPPRNVPPPRPPRPPLPPPRPEPPRPPLLSPRNAEPGSPFLTQSLVREIAGPPLTGTEDPLGAGCGVIGEGVAIVC